MPNGQSHNSVIYNCAAAAAVGETSRMRSFLILANKFQTRSIDKKKLFFARSLLFSCFEKNGNKTRTVFSPQNENFCRAWLTRAANSEAELQRQVDVKAVGENIHGQLMTPGMPSKSTPRSPTGTNERRKLKKS